MSDLSNADGQSDDVEPVPPPAELSSRIVLELGDLVVRLWTRPKDEPWRLLGSACPGTSEFETAMAELCRLARQAGLSDEPAVLLLPDDQVLARPWLADLGPDVAAAAAAWLGEMCNLAAEEAVLAHLPSAERAEPMAVCAHRQTFDEAKAYAEAWGFRPGVVTCRLAFQHLVDGGDVVGFERLASGPLAEARAAEALVPKAQATVPKRGRSRIGGAALVGGIAFVLGLTMLSVTGFGPLAIKPRDPLVAATEPPPSPPPDKPYGADVATASTRDLGGFRTMPISHARAIEDLPARPVIRIGAAIGFARPMPVLVSAPPKALRLQGAGDKPLSVDDALTPSSLGRALTAPAALFAVSAESVPGSSSPRFLPKFPDPHPLRAMPNRLVVAPGEPASPVLETVVGSPSSAAIAPDAMPVPKHDLGLPNPALQHSQLAASAYPAPVPTARPTPYEAGLVKLAEPVAAAPAPRVRPTEVPPSQTVAVVRKTSPEAAASSSVPRAARLASRRSGLELDEVALLGVFHVEDKRQCLLRMPDGQILVAGVGDRVGGWRVRAISRTSVRLSRDGRAQTLGIAGSP